MAQIKKTEARGTIHDLANQLVNLSKMDDIKPKNVKQKAKLKKLFEKYGLFHGNLTNQNKNEIIENLKVMNIDEAKLQRQINILDSIEKFNKIVAKKRREAEKNILSRKNVKFNDDLLHLRAKTELDLPKEVRSNLRLHEKTQKLKPFGKTYTKNRIKYYSGQPFDFVIKTGFNTHTIPYKDLQKLRKEGNAVEYVLNLFQKDVEQAYKQDERKFSKSDPKKWKQKKKVYNKIFEAVKHNTEIATNSTYKKKLTKKNKDGSLKKEGGEYPIQMKIFDELIDLYV